MSAPYGNKNAEKWPLKKAVRLFHDAIELSNQKEQFKIQGNKIEGYSFDFIGELARELGTFHEIFEHLAKRFTQLERLKNQLYTNIQSNCYSNTKKGIIREATGIVNLKSNWNWTDRQASSNIVDIRVKQEPLTKEQADKLIEKL